MVKGGYNYEKLNDLGKLILKPLEKKSMVWPKLKRCWKPKDMALRLELDTLPQLMSIVLSKTQVF